MRLQTEMAELVRKITWSVRDIRAFVKKKIKARNSFLVQGKQLKYRVHSHGHLFSPYIVNSFQYEF